MRPLFLLLFGAVSALAQPFSFGVKAGVPLTDFLNAAESQQFAFNSTTNRYIVGPTAELHLPFGLGVEFDILYRRFDYNGSGTLAERRHQQQHHRQRLGIPAAGEVPVLQ